MNVAALLQDSPSDDIRRRQQQREREQQQQQRELRDRGEREQQEQQQQQNREQGPPAQQQQGGGSSAHRERESHLTTHPPPQHHTHPHSHSQPPHDRQPYPPPQGQPPPQHSPPLPPHPSARPSHGPPSSSYPPHAPSQNPPSHSSGLPHHSSHSHSHSPSLPRPFRGPGSPPPGPGSYLGPPPPTLPPLPAGYSNGPPGGRLPPPSAIIPEAYEVKHRRSASGPEEYPPEMGVRYAPPTQQPVYYMDPHRSNHPHHSQQYPHHPPPPPTHSRSIQHRTSSHHLHPHERDSPSQMPPPSRGVAAETRSLYPVNVGPSISRDGDRDREMPRERERDRDRGMERDRERDPRERDRERDRIDMVRVENQRERDRVDREQRDRSREQRDRDREREYRSPIGPHSLPPPPLPPTHSSMPPSTYDFPPPGLPQRQPPPPPRPFLPPSSSSGPQSPIAGRSLNQSSTSPAMSSLQRPPHGHGPAHSLSQSTSTGMRNRADDAGGPRSSLGGPPPPPVHSHHHQHSAGGGSGAMSNTSTGRPSHHPTSSSSSPMTASSVIPPPFPHALMSGFAAGLAGPPTAGGGPPPPGSHGRGQLPRELMGPGVALSMGSREPRDREGRDRDRERDRDRDRDRDPRDRDADREWREREREMRMKEVGMGHPGMGPGAPREQREREMTLRDSIANASMQQHASDAHGQNPQAWSRFVYARPASTPAGPMGEKEERERALLHELDRDNRKRERDQEDMERMQREQEAERQRERERILQREMEEREAREEKFTGVPRSGRGRTVSEKDVMLQQHEREREMPRDARRRGEKEEHGWMPEPRSAAAGDPAWIRELERERSREQRDRDDELLAKRHGPQAVQQPGHRHYHHHMHFHPPGLPQNKKEVSTPSMQGGERVLQRPPPPPSMMNGGPGPGLSPTAYTQSQPSHPHQAMPHHIHHHHPHPHAHPHAHPQAHPMMMDGYGPGPVSSGGYMYPSSPPLQSRQPLLPALPPHHIGTFIYPEVPFPFLDFPPPPPSAAEIVHAGMGAPPNIDAEVREIHLTILIPSAFLPTQPPARPRLWGGAPVPSFSPLFASPQLLSHLQSGMPYSYMRRGPHPYEVNGTRRVYTDDSDLVSSVVHSGWCSWVGVWRAKRRGLDLRVVVRVTREARFVGGYGRECRSAATGMGKKSASTKEKEKQKDKDKVKGETETDVVMPVSNEFEGGAEDDSEEERAMLVKAGYGEGYDDGRDLLSAGWGNSHDGAGMEILSAEFVKRGYARSHTRHNRSQRMLEYAQRRAALGCGPTCTTLTTTTNLPSSSTPTTLSSSSYSSSQVIRPRKKRRLNPELDVYADRENVNQKGRLCAIQDAEDQDVCAGYTITFSTGSGGFEPAFQYTPSELRSIIFRDRDATSSSSSPSIPSPSSQRKSKRKRSGPREVVVDTSCERFWIAVEDDGDAEGDNKYLVALVPRTRVGPVAEKTSTSIGADSKDAEARTAVESAGADSTSVSEEAKDGQGEEPMEVSPTPTPPAKDVEPVAATTTSSLPQDMEVVKTDPPALSPSAVPADPPAAEPVSSPPSTSTSKAKAESTLQVLHRNLLPSDLDFLKDGVNVLGPKDEAGARKGWRMEAKTWRWCSSEESEAWRKALTSSEVVASG